MMGWEVEWSKAGWARVGWAGAGVVLCGGEGAFVSTRPGVQRKGCVKEIMITVNK